MATNNNQSIEIVLRKISRNYGIALSLLVLVTFGTIAGYASYSAHNGLCALLASKAESITDPLARELMLGNPEQANAMFQDFQTSLSGSVVSNDIQLVLASSKRIGGEKCSPSVFASTIEIPLSFGQKSYGLIAGSASYLSWRIGLGLVVTMIFAILVSLKLFSFSILRRIKAAVLSPIEDLSRGIAISINHHECALEVHHIQQNIAMLTKQIKEAEQDRMALSAKEEIGNLSLQVAHDIRSPLTALRIAIGSSQNLPPDERDLIRGAILRIEAIANDLLNLGRPGPKFLAATPKSEVGSEISEMGKLPAHNISNLLRSAISEKKVELQRSGIEIDLNVDSFSESALARIDRSLFHRVISNLLNNAIEAIQDEGRVQASLEMIDDEIRLCIADNGSGMSPELVAGLLEQGKSFGKERGNGLGLRHARQCVEAWTGCMSIMSRVGQGTKVVISLQSAN